MIRLLTPETNKAKIMKFSLKSYLVGAASVALLSTAAHAQVTLNITGATAFRSITDDRVKSLFDAGYTTILSNASLSHVTYSGTMQTAIPALGSTAVKVRLFFSGSIEGMRDVYNQTPLGFVDQQGAAPTNIGSTNVVPDLAFSDVFPASANPPLPESAFSRTALGVIPMVFVKNNNVAGVTNLTQESALLLMTASGIMPQSYLGGSSADPVYLVGRDSGSGTRATVERCIRFVGTPVLWATNGQGGYLGTTNGYSSGGLVKNAVQGNSDAIGYMSLGDYSGTFTNSATVLNYNGVPFNVTNVYNGAYSIWGYEHIMSRSGGLSANQQLVFNALRSAITNAQFQATNSLYIGRFGELQGMKVERTTDGAVTTSKEF